MFKKILVPIDGSDHAWAALDQAIAIALEENSAIHALFIIDARLLEAPYYVGTDPTELYPDINPMLTAQVMETDKQLHARGNETLEQVKARCQEAGVACEAELGEDIVPNLILKRAKEADLIVMGERGAGAKWAGPLLGSTFEAVVRNAPTPVLATRDKPRSLRRLLVAFDGSERSWDALEIGEHLISEQQRELLLLTVDDGHVGREEAFQQAVDKLAARGIEVPHRLVEGDHPAQKIIETAEQEEIDLIIMGAYGHSHFLKIFFGSTVDDVLHSAPCPILICR